MAEEDILRMSTKEVRRLKVMQDVMAKRITQVKAGEILDLGERQIRRIVDVVRIEGAGGVIHKSRGKPSNRKFPSAVKQRVLRLYQKRYDGFGPTLAGEKLLEIDHIKISDETLRRWLIEAGHWQRRKRKAVHRQWRARKECFGEMIQMDGSHHAWLEERGPVLVLMGYIDDATSEVYGRFYDYEGTLPAMDSFKRYTAQYGLPMSVYLDRHSTYKSTKKLPEGAEDKALPLSQFERALEELGVEVIHAYSPQAKGRVERLFGTLQDRLVKEMRLAGITTREGANAFLEHYWPKYNKQFRVCAANSTNVHVKANRNLDRYLCIKTERTVAKDHTIAHHGRRFQIHSRTAAKRVNVEERCDGSMHLVNNNADLKFTELKDWPAKFSNQPSGWFETVNPY